MTLSMKLRIALLVCASGASIFKGKRYAELFRDLFRDEFIMDEFYVQGQMPLVPSSAEYRVQIGYPENLSEYAMVALTGSRSNSFSQTDEWILNLRKYLAEHWGKERSITPPRLLGVCFGHQVVINALGGATARNPKGWEVGQTRIELARWAQRLFKGKSNISLQSIHRDSVTKVPKGLCIYGRTEKTDFEGVMRFNQSPPISERTVDILTIQAHPEMSGEVVAGLAAKRLCSRCVIVGGGLERDRESTDACNSDSSTCIEDGTVQPGHAQEDVEMFISGVRRFARGELSVDSPSWDSHGCPQS